MSEKEILKFEKYLRLNRCPHCNIAKPSLVQRNVVDTSPAEKSSVYNRWGTYTCASCGGAVIAKALYSPSSGNVSEITEFHPKAQRAQESVPQRAREYLNQAIESKHAPAGAIMLCASAVDAMLKDRGLLKGSLNTRIKEAAKTHLITSDMSEWAHEVRLDANDQRHSDTSQPLPSPEDASRVIDFTLALSDILFVLPERVRRGRIASE